MSNPLDTDAGSELFGTYEAELKLVQADVNQKLDQIPELAGEEKKAAIRGAERAIDEAKELVCRCMNRRQPIILICCAARPDEPRKVQHPHLATLESKLPVPQPPIRH